MKSKPPFLDIPLHDLGHTLRIKRLSLPQKLSVLSAVAALSIDDEDAEEPDVGESTRVWIDVIAMCVVNESGDHEFDSDDGRAFIGSLHMDDLLALQAGISDLNGLAGAARSAEVDAAKND